MKSSPQPRTATIPFSMRSPKMWATQPDFTAKKLQAIKVPVWIVDGDHDEAIKRENTEFMAKRFPPRNCS